uniref:Deuterosome assembly protein 1 n=1 Tax=Macrostomum lignano TaxID=282301 RepID=A0A1I8JK60_9PLAT
MANPALLADLQRRLETLKRTAKAIDQGMGCALPTPSANTAEQAVKNMPPLKSGHLSLVSLAIAIKVINAEFRSLPSQLIELLRDGDLASRYGQVAKLYICNGFRPSVHVVYTARSDAAAALHQICASLPSELKFRISTEWVISGDMDCSLSCGNWDPAVGCTYITYSKLPTEQCVLVKLLSTGISFCAKADATFFIDYCYHTETDSSNTSFFVNYCFRVETDTGFFDYCFRVKANTSFHIEDDTSFRVDADTSFHIEDDTSFRVDADTSFHIEDDHQLPPFRVDADTSFQIEAYTSFRVKANIRFHIEADTSFHIETNTSFRVEANISFHIEADTSFHIEADTSFHIEAYTSFRVKANIRFHIEATPASTLKPTPASTLKPTPASASRPTPASTLKLTPASTLKQASASTLKPTPASTLKPTPASALHQLPRQGQHSFHIEADTSFHIKADTSFYTEADTCFQIKADISFSVEADTSFSVKANTSFRFEVDTSFSVGDDTSFHIEADVSFHIEADVSFRVEADTSLQIKADISYSVKTDASFHTEADSSFSVEADTSYSVKANTSFRVEADTSFSVGADTSFHIEADVSFRVEDDTSFRVEADTSFHVKADTSFRVEDDTSFRVEDDTSFRIESIAVQFIRIPLPSRNKQKIQRQIQKILRVGHQFQMRINKQLPAQSSKQQLSRRSTPQCNADHGDPGNNISCTFRDLANSQRIINGIGVMNKSSEAEATMLDLMPSACEAELQNLMYHIDQMIQSKRAEWERELQTVQTRLASKERECALLRSDLGEQSKELESLRRRLSDSGRSSGEQVQALHKELLALGKQHERLCRNHRKQEQQLQKEAAAAKAQLQTETASLGQQLADSAAEKQRLQWELAEVRAQRDGSDEKLQLMQDQSAAYADQLEKRKRLSEQAEAALKRTIEQLEHQLEKSKDQLESQSSSAAKLKSRLAESSAACCELTEEKERLESELQSARKSTQRAEVEASRLAMELRAREAELRELHSSAWDKVSANPDICRGDRGCQTELTSSELGRLADELDSGRHRPRRRRGEADQLRRQCRELGAELESVRAASTARRDADRAQLDGLREALAGLEAQISGVTAQRDCQVDRLATAERRAAAAADEVERCQVELGAVTAQLEALRLENSQLRSGRCIGASATATSGLEVQRQDWQSERRSLLQRLAAAEARADRAESENRMLSSLIGDDTDFEDYYDDRRNATDAKESVVRRIDGHVTELKRQTDLVLSEATQHSRTRQQLALPSATLSTDAAAVASTPLASGHPLPQMRKLVFS